MLDEPTLALHALMAVGKLKVLSARPRVESLLKHPMPAIREQARKTLRELDA